MSSLRTNLALSSLLAHTPHEHRVFVRLTSVAVLVSLTVLCVSLAILQGFLQVYTGGILRMQAPIVVLPPSETFETEAVPAWWRDLRQTGGRDAEAMVAQITRVTPFLAREGMLLTPAGMQGAVLKGIPAADLRAAFGGQLRGLAGPEPVALEEDTDGALPVVIGAELLTQLSTQSVQPFRFVVADGRDAQSAVARTMVVRVVGTFTTGVHEFDGRYLLADLARLQAALGQADVVSGYELTLRQPAQSAVVAQWLWDQLPADFIVREWRELYRDAFDALQLEQLLFTAVLSLLVVVAMGNVALVILLQLLRYAPTAAVLLALGLTPRRVQWLFWAKGMRVGGAGIAAGLLVGLGLVWLLQHGVQIPLDPEVYFVSRVPAALPWPYAAGLVGGSLLLCHLSAWWAARRLATMPLLSALGRGYVQ